MRRRIIEYIQVKRVASAAELGRALHITPADARHHLASLEVDGVVRIVDTRVSGRGRPTQLYRLIIDLNRNNLDALAKVILKEWLAELPVEKKEAALKRIATDLLQNISTPEGNLTQRLTRAVRQMIGLNYQARWEAHMNSPRILVTHCPYALMVKEYPDICRVDELLIGKLIGLPIELISRLKENEFGEMQCIFRLGSV